MKTRYSKPLVLAALCLGLCSQAFGQRAKFGKVRRGELRFLRLPGGAKLFHRSGEFDLTHNLTVDPKASYRKVKLYWNVQKLKLAKGVRWQLSRAAFPKFAGGKQSDLNPAGLVRSGHGTGPFGLFTIDFKTIKANNPSSNPFYARAIPVDAAGKKIVGKPTNVIKIYYGNGPTQPPTKFKDRFHISRFAKHLEKSLKGRVAGFQFVASKSGEKTWRVAGGFARGPLNSPMRYMKTSDRLNIASVNKTITAVATLQLLKKRSLTIHSKIHHWLPKTWAKGPYINTITFKELMTHRSGFRHSGDLKTDYFSLKSLVKNGVTPANKAVRQYQNHNFALLRIIIPILNGYKPPTYGSVINDIQIGKETSARYLAYINNRIFKPRGISRVYAKPVGSSPALCYADTKGIKGGTTFGDFTDRCGGGCLHMSTNDLDRFLAGLRSTSLLSATQKSTMFANRLGVYRGNVKNGYYYTHNGALNINGAKVRSVIVYFSNGTNVSVIVNSATPKDLTQLVKDAFNASWGL